MDLQGNFELCHILKLVCSGMPRVLKTLSLRYLRKGMVDYFQFLYVNRPLKLQTILLI